MEKAIFYPFLMIVFMITMVGGWIPTFKLWTQETFRLVISFCAGILLGAVFFHILPEISMVLANRLGYSIMFGFLLQWPTLITLAMFPVLLWMYARLSINEEREAEKTFGEAWRHYANKTPRFLPRLRGLGRQA